MNGPDTCGSSSTTKQPISVKYAGFQDFMMKHQHKKGENNNKEITNTRIGSKENNIYGGSYSITKKNMTYSLAYTLEIY